MRRRPFLTKEPTKVYRPRKRGTRLWLNVIFISVVTGFAGMSTIIILLRCLPLPDQSVVNPTEIESDDGLRLAEWTSSGTEQQAVPLSRIPQALINATLAVEDTNFYRDHAIDLKSTARALLVNMKHGSVVQGGSTITQQLAKNLFLSQDRTYSRKVREALFAMQLELHEPKDWILGRYLNVVYYGHGAYGVQSAARLYFNKSVDELNVAECALLAGLPKGPSIYSPLTSMDKAKERQHVVLQRMVAAGYLTQEAARTAYNTPITIAKFHSPIVQAPYFTQVAVDEAKRQYQVTNEQLYQGDVRIHTTLDPLLQQAAERALMTTLPKHSDIQAALVAMDPETGAIKALVGGRNFRMSPYNRVLAPRQPGSTFKGILYTAALEHGWTPANEVDSKLTTFVYGPNHDKQYTVHDYGDFYAERPLTLREALARSDNVYAVHTNLAIGPEAVVEMGHRMGISSTLKPYPSLALGVFPVTPLEMATAYATLANGGYKVSPYTVKELDSPGNSVQVHPEKEHVVSPQIAYQMTDLLTSVMERNGTGYSVRNYLHNVAAAKTGTTDTDAWMVGYTPNLVCAVWVGYDTNKPLTVAESHLAAPIWAKFMGTAQSHMPYDGFRPVPGLTRVTLDPLTGKVATPLCRTTEVDYFIPGTEPAEPCPVHSPPKPDQPKGPTNKLFEWFKKLF
ncbi:transglycosylase domain-containing protein [Alicyclobacillus dauci]|uniref:PBP1A family penicillin-binding protein n=1 Tax=Alicyclobacillus dauci TaxID=1475485 RepID=A0ABY6Z246_9BACL|nr:PBP1A family penicillin-binding protein [Alicyclobacillus dauci]WAH36901.1 PBP1A family penicillin-binding protein [Alicyclobacillus dauci]